MALPIRLIVGPNNIMELPFAICAGARVSHHWCEDEVQQCTELSEVCTQGSFIMFSKDNKVNMSDMLGYYASVELRNNSTTEAELFNVGTTFYESSK